MPEDVDTRVSPAIDPERFRLMEGYGDDTRPFVDPVVQAYSDIYQTIGKIYDLRRVWDSNPAVTKENRILIVSKESAAQREHALNRLAGAERTLRTNIASAEEQLTKPLTERAGLGSLNSEVRAYARSLTREKRSALIREAFEKDDEPTLTAILGAQPFLSGLSQEDHAFHLRSYHERRNPALVRRLDLMNRFLAEVERNTPIVIAQFEKAVGATPSATARLRELDDQAKAALADLKAKRA